MQADSLRIELSGKESEYNAYFYSFTGTCAVLSHSVVSDSVTPWTVAHQVPLSRASLVAQLIKNLPAIQETLVRSLGREDPLEKGKATHSRILA